MPVRKERGVRHAVWPARPIHGLGPVPLCELEGMANGTKSDIGRHFLLSKIPITEGKPRRASKHPGTLGCFVIQRVDPLPESLREG